MMIAPIRATRSLCLLGCGALLAVLSPLHSEETAAPQPEVSRPQAVTDTAEAETVIVTVDGEKLTESMMQKQVQRQIQSMMAEGQVPPQQFDAYLSQLRQYIEEQFVVGVLLRHEAARRKFIADKADVDQTVAELNNRLPPGMSMEEALRQEGMTEEVLRRKIGEDLGVRKMLEVSLGEEQAVNENEIAEYYDGHKVELQIPESVRARHILIKADAGADGREKARKKAEGIRKQLLEGADFARLAREESDCPSSRNGGELDTFGRGRMVPGFEKAAFSQKLNEIGPVVESRFGYHVIEVLEHNDARIPELAEVREKIADDLKKKKEAARFQTYVDGLRAKATITRSADAQAQ